MKRYKTKEQALSTIAESRSWLTEAVDALSPKHLSTLDKYEMCAVATTLMEEAEVVHSALLELALGDDAYFAMPYSQWA